MTDKFVGNIEDMVAQWHYYKNEVLELLGVKANKSDVPTTTSQLENDVPYIKERDFQFLVDGVNEMNVELNKNNGLLIFTLPRFKLDD